MLVRNSYKPLITKPTRITSTTVSLIDHMWSNDIENSSFSTYLLVTDTTDHLLCIAVKNHITHYPRSNKAYTTYRPMTDKNRQYFIDKVKYAEPILKFHSENPYTDTQTKYNDYFFHLTKLYDESFPVKRKKVNYKSLSKPWITTELLRLIKKKNKLYSQKSKRNDEYIAQKYRACKRDVTEKLKIAKRDYYHKKLYHESLTLKKKWEHLRTLIRRKKGTVSYCPISSAILGKHYSTVAKKLSKNLPQITTEDIPHRSNELCPYDVSEKTKGVKEPFSFRKITNIEVYESLLKLDKNKGPGLDNLDVKSIKAIANVISPHLCTLFNDSIEYSIYPDIFKIAKCVPIYKGNPLDPYEAANYRPISILNCINKTLEKLLHDQIYYYLEVNKLFPDFQYGYRKQRSTNQALLKFSDIIEEGKLNKQVNIAIFMDLSKAFDTVDKDILCSKLNDLGFSIKSNNMLYDYMSKRRLCMKDNIQTIYPLNFGVPQGSILGPLLFLTYIHDMDSFCKNLHKIVYADDTTVIVTGRNLKEAEDYANDILQQFYTYFTYNKLSINESKTKYMIYDFRARKEKLKDARNTKLTMNKTLLQEIDKIRFLGVIINNKLTWDDHKYHIKSKVCKAMGMLYSSRDILKNSDIINIYNSFIQPYFNYCITLWGASIRSKTDTLTVLQNKLLRIMFSCKRTTDAWEYDKNNQILQIEQLYLLEIAKLCFKHHTNTIPDSLSMTMPDICNERTTRQTRSMTQHNYVHNNKSKKTLPKNCVWLWNSLPSDIKQIAYSNHKETSIQTFTNKVKSFIHTNANHN